jgi:hypothetical protein
VETIQYWGAYTNFDSRVRNPASGGPARSDLTPNLFRTQLVQSFAAMVEAQTRFVPQNLYFIMAWNEWGEQAILEPDEKNGFSYLLSVKIALESVPARIFINDGKGDPEGAAATAATKARLKALTPPRPSRPSSSSSSAAAPASAGERIQKGEQVLAASEHAKGESLRAQRWREELKATGALPRYAAPRGGDAGASAGARGPGAEPRLGLILTRQTHPSEAAFLKWAEAAAADRLEPNVAFRNYTGIAAVAEAVAAAAASLQSAGALPSASAGGARAGVSAAAAVAGAAADKADRAAAVLEHRKAKLEEKRHAMRSGGGDEAGGSEAGVGGVTQKQKDLTREEKIALAASRSVVAPPLPYVSPPSVAAPAPKTTGTAPAAAAGPPPSSAASAAAAAAAVATGSAGTTSTVGAQDHTESSAKKVSETKKSKRISKLFGIF